MSLHVVWHRLQPASRAEVSIALEKVASLCLNPFVDVTGCVHAALSALNNGAYPPLRSVHMLDPLRYCDDELRDLRRELPLPGLELRDRELKRMVGPELSDGALKALETAGELRKNPGGNVGTL